MKNKVLQDARKQIRQKWREWKHAKKENQKAYFKRLYDKPREINFKSWGEVNMDKHFFFPKFKEDWAFGKITPLSALAVYPVICSRVDFRDYNKWFQISLENIAKLTGASVNTVSDGIEHFMNISYALSQNDEVQCYLLERKMTHEGKRHFYVYRAGFIRNEMIGKWRDEKNPKQKDYFKFYTCIIDTGLWAKLRPRAKAFYLALRSCSRFDHKAYALIEEGMPTEELDQVVFSEEEYRARKWEICDTPTAHLCRMVNISASDIQQIVEELEQHGLVEKIDRWYKVYLWPQEI